MRLRFFYEGITMKTATKSDDDLDLSAFIATIPSVEKIRERMKSNAAETSVLRKLLRLAVARDKAANGGEA